jgi:SAM-dependent methyltransferase/uncharacterized protein YbaR (Trm112 family)
VDPWLREHLVCPRDHSQLRQREDTLVCDQAHTYPYVGGIPVMLTRDLSPTQHHVWELTLGDRQQQGWTTIAASGSSTPGCAVHPYVQEVVAATNGMLYDQLVRKLTRYPIPDIRLPTSDHEYFLDIGCNWGRWSISAAKKGYVAIGIDPNLEAIRAARAVAQQLEITCLYVVADARSLPFSVESFDVVFSYSVLQHFAKRDVRLAIAQIAKVLKQRGRALIQMANAFGPRSLVHQLGAVSRRPREFDVRYWLPSEIVRAFEDGLGPASLAVDGYFGLGLQAADVDLMPARYRMLIEASELLRSLSERRGLRWMTWLADSVYVTAHRPGARPPLAVPRA